FFTSHDHDQHIHSFPTRRSSDLTLNEASNLAATGYNGETVGQGRNIRGLSLGEHHANRYPGFRIDGRQARNDLRASRTRSGVQLDRKSTRLNSSHVSISYAVFCL